MKQMANPVPPSLFKKGITKIEDNLLPGQEISFAKPFCQIFRFELEARFFKPKKKPAVNQQPSQTSDVKDILSSTSNPSSGETA